MLCAIDLLLRELFPEIASPSEAARTGYDTQAGAADAGEGREVTLTHSLSLALTHSRSLSLTLTHSHSLSLTLTHSLTPGSTGDGAARGG